MARTMTMTMTRTKMRTFRGICCNVVLLLLAISWTQNKSNIEEWNGMTAMAQPSNTISITTPTPSPSPSTSPSISESSASNSPTSIFSNTKPSGKTFPPTMPSYLFDFDLVQPTSKPTLPQQSHTLPNLQMTLHPHSSILAGKALQSWIQITGATIQEHIMLEGGGDIENVVVAIDVLDQFVVLDGDFEDRVGLGGGFGEFGDVSGMGGGGVRRKTTKQHTKQQHKQQQHPTTTTEQRHLQSSAIQQSIQIKFTARLVFSSSKNSWFIPSLIAGGFFTWPQQRNYLFLIEIFSLREVRPTHLKFQIGGMVVAESTKIPGWLRKERDSGRASSSAANNGGGGGGSDPYTPYIIVGAVLAGLCLVVVAIGAFLIVGKRKEIQLQFLQFQHQLIGGGAVGEGGDGVGGERGKKKHHHHHHHLEGNEDNFGMDLRNPALSTSSSLSSADDADDNVSALTTPTTLLKGGGGGGDGVSVLSTPTTLLQDDDGVSVLSTPSCFVKSVAPANDKASSSGGKHNNQMPALMEDSLEDDDGVSVLSTPTFFVKGGGGAAASSGEKKQMTHPSHPEALLEEDDDDGVSVLSNPTCFVKSGKAAPATKASGLKNQTPYPSPEEDDGVSVLSNPTCFVKDHAVAPAVTASGGKKQMTQPPPEALLEDDGVSVLSTPTCFVKGGTAAPATGSALGEKNNQKPHPFINYNINRSNDESSKSADRVQDDELLNEQEHGLSPQSSKKDLVHLNYALEPEDGPLRHSSGSTDRRYRPHYIEKQEEDDQFRHSSGSTDRRYKDYKVSEDDSALGASGRSDYMHPPYHIDTLVLGESTASDQSYLNYSLTDEDGQFRHSLTDENGQFRHSSGSSDRRYRPHHIDKQTEDDRLRHSSGSSDRRYKDYKQQDPPEGLDASGKSDDMHRPYHIDTLAPEDRKFRLSSCSHSSGSPPNHVDAQAPDDGSHSSGNSRKHPAYHMDTHIDKFIDTLISGDDKLRRSTGSHLSGNNDRIHQNSTLPDNRQLRHSLSNVDTMHHKEKNMDDSKLHNSAGDLDNVQYSFEKPHKEETLKKDLHRQLSEGNQKLHSFIDYKYNRNQDIDDSDDDIHLVETLYNGKVPGDIKLHRSTGCSPNTTLSIGETPPDNDKFRHSMGSSNLQRRSSKKSTSPKSRKSEYPATLMKQYAFPEDDRLRNSLRSIDGSGRSSRSPRSRKSEPSATARNEDNSPKKLNKSGRVLHSYSIRSSRDQIGKKTKRNPDELQRRSSGLGDKERSSRKIKRKKKIKKAKQISLDLGDAERRLNALLNQNQSFRGKFVTIIAPSGKLDLSIISSPPSSVGSPSSPTFNPNKLLPIIYDMKEGSVLQGRAQVGDRILAIDEVNCKHMTTEAVTALIRQRKGNDFRTFVLVRENLDELDVPWLDSST